MKRIFLPLLTFSAVVATAFSLSRYLSVNEAVLNVNMNESVCDWSISRYAPEELNILEGVSLINAAYAPVENKIEITLQNNTSESFGYGYGITLEMQIDDIWYEVPYSDQIYFSREQAQLIPLSEVIEKYELIIWSDVSSGLYRIVKDISPYDNYSIERERYYLSINITVFKEDVEGTK
jgi:hypothetical protein